MTSAAIGFISVFVSVMSLLFVFKAPEPVVQPKPILQAQTVKITPVKLTLIDLEPLKHQPELADELLLFNLKNLIIQQDTQEINNYFEVVKDLDLLSFVIKEAKWEMAEYYFSVKDNEKASLLYRQLVQKTADKFFYPKALKRLIELDLQQADTKSAVQNYKKWILAYPNIDSKYDVFNKIKDTYNEISTKNLFVLAEDIHKYANNLYEQGKYAQAREQLARLIDAYPNYAKLTEARTTLGMTYLLEYEYDKAIQIFDQILAVADRHSINYLKALFYTARSWSGKQQYQKACSLYVQIIEQYGKNANFVPLAYYYLYATLGAMDKSEEFRPYLARFKASYPDSLYYNKIVWEQGLAAYQDKHYQEAFSSFASYSALAPSNELKSKLLFWQAQSLVQINELDKAANLRLQCVRRYPFYYATFRILDDRMPIKAKTMDVKFWQEHLRGKLKPSGLKLEAKYQLLVNAGLIDFAIDELNYLMQDDVANREKYRLQLALLYQKKPDYYQVNRVLAAKYNLLDCDVSSVEKFPLEIAQMLYPLHHWAWVKKYAAEFGVDPFLLISLMRAESTYHDKVYSRSGAVGLMQVMPSTGQGIASHLKVKWDGAQTLLDAETNIRFGAYYLGYLNKRFEGNVYWMLSGYNGGPSITSRWIKDFGHEDMDTAVFRIPYQETQYYLQKVMQNYWIYKVLYG